MTAAPDGSLEFRTVLRAKHGLHARPAALVVTALAELDAEVDVVAPDGSVGDASSITQLQALDLAHGDQLLVRASGPDAQAALDAVRALAERDFGDRPDVATAS
ncbi:HPr family phosphocarrier protein [Luteococcus sp. H138]|uniref:HPr family phosphocarrier protein n=1 Tax=unclassified Luteococcus TaxID=2639923 RepID=UPI00313D9EDD